MAQLCFYETKDFSLFYIGPLEEDEAEDNGNEELELQDKDD
jgi:hypothetical protein